MSALPHFDYHRPESLEEALELLADLGGEARILAGGTDLLAKLRSRSLRATHLVSLRRVEELAVIGFDEKSGLTIGGGASVSAVGSHPAVQGGYPTLAHACRVLATPQIRNMATVAGNLANAAPSADTACPLLIHDARLQLATSSGEREIDLADFFQGPGKVDLAPGEMIRKILVPPPPPGSGSAYQRISGRSRVDIAAAMTAVLLVLDPAGETIERARIALGSVAPTPLRVEAAEAILIGAKPSVALFEKAARICEEAAAPIDDVRAGAAWRSTMVRVLSRRALEEAVEAARGGRQ
jgi:CO/xanthine dehydrogenase FAD-binding subunit